MIVDLRSDTLTKPCQAMRKAMADADVGDDVFEEDPTVIQLEQKLAERAGHEAGLFFPTGTQSNLVALLSWCQRGDEYIVGQNAHTYRYEAGGAAVLGSIQPQPLEHDDDGTIPLAKIRAAIKPDDVHFANTRVLALENTIGGKILPPDYVAEAAKLAADASIIFHLDGARAFNAAVGQGVELAQITGGFDSASICLSKGLGAPIGSVLVSNKAMIKEARRWRKMVGGGMRQVGVLAAAGLYAIQHNVARLSEDHVLAQKLVDRILGLDGLTIVGDCAHTNMLFLRVDAGRGADFLQFCKRHGVLFTGAEQARLVVHKDISEAMIEHAAEVIRRYFESVD